MKVISRFQVWLLLLLALAGAPLSTRAQGLVFGATASVANIGVSNQFIYTIGVTNFLVSPVSSVFVTNTWSGGVLVFTNTGGFPTFSNGSNFVFNVGSINA